MKISHTLQHLWIAGNGITDTAVELMLEQRSQGHDVSVIAEDGGYREQLEAAGVDVHLLPTHWRPVGGLVRRMLAVNRVLRALQPDVVHAHTPAGAVPALMSRSRWGVVATAHNEFSRGTLVFAACDRVIAVSEGSADRIRKWARGARCVVVRNGALGRRRVTAPESSDEPPTRSSVLFVGGLFLRKGVDVLLQAAELVAKDVPDATWRVVGEGPDREEFHRATAEMDRRLGRRIVEFIGFSADPRPWYRATDVFVLPSRREPFGLVLAEAREAGVAIVASDVDGIPDALDGGRAGMLVPSEDAAALASAVRTLLVDPAVRQDWAAAARTNTEWLSVDRMARETFEVYREVTAARGRRRRAD